MKMLYYYITKGIVAQVFEKFYLVDYFLSSWGYLVERENVWLLRIIFASFLRNQLQ